METDEQLIARYKSVRKDHAKVVKSMERSKLGSDNRTRKALWAGSLFFLLLGMEREMEERGLKKPQED